MCYLKKQSSWSGVKWRICDLTSGIGQFIFKSRKSIYALNILVCHTNPGLVNWKRFLKKNKLFYPSLNGLVSSSTILTTWYQDDQNNSSLEYQSPILTRKSSAFKSLDLGIPLTPLVDKKNQNIQKWKTKATTTKKKQH